MHSTVVGVGSLVSSTKPGHSTAACAVAAVLCREGFPLRRHGTVIYLNNNTADDRPVGLCGASAYVAYVPCTP
jgi:hypothetical protein